MTSGPDQRASKFRNHLISIYTAFNRYKENKTTMVILEFSSEFWWPYCSAGLNWLGNFPRGPAYKKHLCEVI